MLPEEAIDPILMTFWRHSVVLTPYKRTDQGTHNDHEQTLHHHEHSEGTRQLLQRYVLRYAEIEVHQRGAT